MTNKHHAHAATHAMTHATEPAGHKAAARSAVEPAMFSALEWRLIGPHRGGRVVAVAGDPVERQVFYFGSTGGGVWKSTDGGLYWHNISDGFFHRASVGALAVAPSDPNVLYAGMGETTIRNDVSHGDGMYRSTDAGHTWHHLGLEATRHIAKVRVHPADPDIVYVAALGHAHGPNAERGVYRSRDGGTNWQQVLARGEHAGAIDLAMDPCNPRILYAAFWEAYRGPHVLISGGAGSGIFKSVDGGESWIELTRNQGLPTGTLGKIGITASAARPGRVWAIIEAEDGAVFCSDDGGTHWERRCEERNLRQRAWYYHHIIADPQDAETLWVLNVQAWKSINGGRTFAEVPIPHGDNHDLWIDPRDPRRMIAGHDGGACVSFTGGEAWSSIYNQPTAEMYHVTTDSATPYRVYGAQQDNTTIGVPSRSPRSGIDRSEWIEVGGGESGYIAVRPDNPNVIFAGSYQGYLTRYDRRTEQLCNIAVWPELASGWGAHDMKYRFPWTYPIVLSPHDPDVLYVTGNYVFRSDDEGSKWEAISPDLTRNDPARMGASGGPITKDNTGAEYYGTIFAFAESPARAGVLWAGSDDGLIHVSRDGGTSWTNVTPRPKLLPEWALINIIEPSPHNPVVAYVAATRYRLDDFQPYLLKTDDYGRTWTAITQGIGADDFTRVIREDPLARGLLYAGTETGVHVSFDDGERWQPLQLNLPVVPIHDITVHGSDLVVATHGRSFWVLDDISPLRELAGAVPTGAAYLFAPCPTLRFASDDTGHAARTGTSYDMTGTFIVTTHHTTRPSGEKVAQPLDAGANPPRGVMVRYYLKEQPADDIRLLILDATGQEIRAFSSAEPATATVSGGAAPDVKEDETREPRLPKAAGTNRFVWDMRYPEPAKIDGYVASEAAMAGPLVPPGEYAVRLIIADTVLTQPFIIEKDPRLAVTQADLGEQFQLLVRLRDTLSAVHEAINQLRAIRGQAQEWERRAREQPGQDTVAAAAGQLAQQVTAIEEELTQTKAKSRQDTLNYPAKLNAKLAYLSATVASADAAPTQQAYALAEDLAARADALLARVRALVAVDVPAFNAEVSAAALPAVAPPAAPHQ